MAKLKPTSWIKSQLTAVLGFATLIIIIGVVVYSGKDFTLAVGTEKVAASLHATEPLKSGALPTSTSGSGLVANGNAIAPNYKNAPALARSEPEAQVRPRHFRAHGFYFELSSCTTINSGAECIGYLSVDTKKKWFFTGKDYLVADDGSPIMVSWMKAGGIESNVSPGPRHRAQSIALEPGIRTEVVYRFDGTINPSKIQALVVHYYYALNPATASLGISWK